MLKRLLYSLLLARLSIAADLNKDLRDLTEAKNFWLNKNDTIGTFFKNKTTIAENELNHLTQALDELETSKKGKRETENNLMYVDEQLADATNQQRLEDENANFEVESSIKDVQVPMKGGSPAFSIHADKVYILYPSLFQDPNIFGRFSIPQNINLDPLPEKKILKDNDESKNLTPPPSTRVMKSPPPQQSATPLNDVWGYNNPPGRKIRRQAPNPNPNPTPPAHPKPMAAKKEDNKKRNVESHLTGTIVVFNQDVNEHNRKESY